MSSTQQQPQELQQAASTSYLCSLLVLDGDLVSCRKSFFAHTEADAVRYALALLVGAKVLHYDVFKSDYALYKESLIEYQKHCIKNNVESDVVFFMKQNKKNTRCFFFSTWFHSLLLNDDSKLEFELCDEQKYLSRLFRICTLNDLNDMLILFLSGEFGNDNCRVFFECVDLTQKSTNKFVSASSVQSLTSSKEAFIQQAVKQPLVNQRANTNWTLADLGI
jgi:hypothetical protein